MSEESRNLSELLDRVEEFFLDPRERWRVRALRDRIRALEDENARLRAALVAKPTSPSPRSDGDPWAVPDEEPAAGTRVAAAPVREVAKGARFACRKCGELRAEPELVRVGRELCCPGCVDDGGGDDPLTSGSYR